MWNCFAGPPSAPRNVISNINETSVILDWSWPLDTGGRKDITFNIICKKCGWTVRQCEPCSPNVRFLPRQLGLTNTTVTVTDLLAHTNYTFEIDAINGVSELSSSPRQYAAVSITTNQAGEYTLAASDFSCHGQPSLVCREEKKSRKKTWLHGETEKTPNTSLISC